MSVSGKSYWISAIALTGITWVTSAMIYPTLPDRVPIHWNLQGQVDGYGSKMVGTLLMPAMLVGFLLLFAALPKLSPKQFQIETFYKTYLMVMVMVTGLFAYLHFIILYATAHGELDMSRAVIGGILFFFVILGNVLGKVRRNFYIGVRTPWTLASERVWNDTHRLSAWIFVAAGLLGISLLLTPLPVYWVFAIIMLAALIPIVYSFVHYKRLERQGLLDGNPL